MTRTPAATPAPRKGWVAGIVATVLVLLGAGCGDSDDGPATGQVSVADAWARTSPANAENAAFYFRVDNGTDADTSVTAATSATCKMAELHRSAMGDDGVMSMAPAATEDLVLPARSTAVFEPGGLHVMCMGLAAPLAAGDEVALTLSLADGTDIDVTVEVREG